MVAVLYSGAGRKVCKLFLESHINVLVTVIWLLFCAPRVTDSVKRLFYCSPNTAVLPGAIENLTTYAGLFIVEESLFATISTHIKLYICTS